MVYLAEVIIFQFQSRQTYFLQAVLDFIKVSHLQGCQPSRVARELPVFRIRSPGSRFVRQTPGFAVSASDTPNTVHSAPHAVLRG